MAYMMYEQCGTRSRREFSFKIGFCSTILAIVSNITDLNGLIIIDKTGLDKKLEKDEIKVGECGPAAKY